jgi:structural maintenance of chromosome 1
MNTGKILHLELVDFKSYRGKHIIGPFKSTNSSIIGCNGSGKSNVMDSISFVMGLKAIHLRATNLRELIYSGDSKYTPKSASVKLVFETTEKDEIHFMRTIASSGTSVYTINDKVVSAQEYDAQLEELGIITRARNFLVFQGEVEGIAAKSPKELAKLIEQVSGSDQFVKEYDTLKEERERAHELLIASVNKKKGVTIEKNKYKLQKKDAERFTELKEEEARLQSEHYLWKLYYIEKGIKKNKLEKESLNLEVEKLANSTKTAETALVEKRKAHAKIKKESLDWTKNYKKHSKTLQDVYTTLAENKIAVSHLEKTLETQKKELEKNSTLISHQSEEIKQVESQIKQVKRESAEFEKNLSLSEKKEIKFADKQLDEYNKLKTQAGTQTITLSQELGKLKEEYSSLMNHRETLTIKMEQLDTRKTQLIKSHADLEDRLSKLQELISTTTLDLEKKKSSKTTLEKQNVEIVKKKDKIESQLLEIKDKLARYKMERKENERDVRFNEALESMKRLFPGVKGKVYDLCKISSDRYTISVTVALGKNINSIVVDTEKTALECIAYLKEQRIGKATFLPMDTIKTKKINEKYRTLGDGYKLAVDVLSFEEAYTGIFTYSLGNTIICDSLEDANELYDSMNEKLKIVTVDGSLINKSGIITGGMAEMERHTSKWQLKDSTALKQQRDTLVGELGELVTTLSSNSNSITKLESEIQTLENRVKYTTIDVVFSEKKIESIEVEQSSISEGQAQTSPELTKIQKTLDELEVKMKSVTLKIRQIEESIFASFSKQVGVENIRDYEEGVLKQQQEAIKKRADFKLLLSRLVSKLDYENSRILKNPHLQEGIEENVAKLADLEQQEEKLTKEIKTLEEGAKKLKNQAKDQKTKTEDLEAEMYSIGEKIENCNKDIQKKLKSVTVKENQIEQLRNQRNEIFRKCQVEDIALPTGGDSKRRKKNEESDEEDLGDQEEFIPLSEPFSVSQETPSQAQVRQREETEQIALNFASLKKKLLNLDANGCLQVEAEYKRELAETIDELTKLAPSVGFSDKLDSVTAKFNEFEESVNNAKAASKEADIRFEQCKTKRYDMFMKAYEPISESIDEIYKEVTKGDQSKMGGTAFLGLEDMSEPYNAGVKFNAMPPLKRYRDMTELSGGEKTLASIALLFAIHQFRPSPFYILDEVDAALDNANVKKLANFVMKKSKDLQFLVISLKDTFFSKSDALIGVCKDKKEKTSMTLTLDLTNFEEKEEKE